MATDSIGQTAEVVAILEANPEGMARGEILERLSFSINTKTLQRRLAALCDDGRIVKHGDRRAAKYYPAYGVSERKKGQGGPDRGQIFSLRSQEILRFLDSPPHAREPVSFNRELLDSYVPNQTAYIPIEMRRRLLRAGRRFDKTLVAGTYARQICQRLLIDLSYNSSRLEGNTYSKLDTQQLVEKGIAADGKIHEETVMIMNHKEAILFLIENAQDIELNSFAIFNLHNLLSQDLLANPESCGNIRSIEVSIGQSVYKPLNNPHRVKELFELVLLKARKIHDPFEQSFFLLVHLSYLQAFEDVNKRTSRLACNIPLIKQNLCPLSFTDVSRDDYNAALLAIYEQNETTPMLDLFAWAYARSCLQYGVVRESLGEIDAYRIQYRQQRKEIMGRVVKNGLHGEEAGRFIERYCQENQISQCEKFVAMTLADLAILHAGAIVGLGISEAELDVWLKARP